MTELEDLGKRLLVEVDRCIGCLACSSVCPENLITSTDQRGQRTLTFPARCDFMECMACAEQCSEEAVSFVSEPAGANGEPQVLSLDLAICQGCSTPFTPQRLLDRVIASLSESMAVGTDTQWMALCPECRRLIQGDAAES